MSTRADNIATEFATRVEPSGNIGRAALSGSASRKVPKKITFKREGGPRAAGIKNLPEGVQIPEPVGKTSEIGKAARASKFGLSSIPFFPAEEGLAAILSNKDSYEDLLGDIENSKWSEVSSVVSMNNPNPMSFRFPLDRWLKYQPGKPAIFRDLYDGNYLLFKQSTIDPNIFNATFMGLVRYEDDTFEQEPIIVSRRLVFYNSSYSPVPLPMLVSVMGGNFNVQVLEDNLDIPQPPITADEIKEANIPITRKKLDKSQKSMLMAAGVIAVDNQSFGGYQFTQFITDLEEYTTPKRRFIATIAKTIFTMPRAYTQVVIKFDKKDSKSVETIYRTVVIGDTRNITPEQAAEIMVEKIDIMRDESKEIGKSDAISIKYLLNCREFSLGQFIPKLGAGSGKQSRKAVPIMVPGLKLSDFDRSNSGDNCLLAQLRGLNLEMSDNATPFMDKTSVPNANLKQIRKYIEIPDGPITADFETFDKIGKKLGIWIRLVDGVEHIKTSCDTLTRNYTHVKTIPRVIIDAGTKSYNECSHDVYLAAGHYYAVDDYPKISFCEFSGIEKIKPSEKISLKRQRQQIESDGRIWIEPAKEPRAKGVHESSGEPMKDLIIVFDYETIFNPDTNKLEPYQLGYAVFDPSHNADMSALEVDINTVFESKNPEREISERLINFVRHAPHNIRYTLVSFNGVRFDNYILAKGLNSCDMLSDAFITDAGIRDIKIWRHTTLDLANIQTAMSLADACAAYKTVPTKVEGYDHHEIQLKYNAGELRNFWLENDRTMKEYLTRDIQCTASLFIKIKDALTIIDPEINIFGPGAVKTVGGIAWKLMGKKCPDIIACAPSLGVDEFIRRGIIAGRTQRFTPEPVEMLGVNMRMGDFKSLYPTAMAAIQKIRDIFDAEGLACALWGAYPIGPYLETPEYVPGRVGVYECKIVKQPDNLPAVIPQRTKGEPLNWTPSEAFDTVITHCDIEIIRHYGGIVEVGKGIYFEQHKFGVFAPFIQQLADMKDEQDRFKDTNDTRYNPALRQFVKTIMNSGSGKCVQQNYTERAYIAKGHNEQLMRFNQLIEPQFIPLTGESVIIYGKVSAAEAYDTRKAKPSILGVLIYSYARSLVYSTLCQHNILYCDTDSGLFLKEDYDRLMNHFPTLDIDRKGSASLGDIEEELLPCKKPADRPTSFDVYLIKPKEYYIQGFNADGKKVKNKIRGKGVGLSDTGRDHFIPPEHLETLKKFSDVDLAYEYHNDITKPETVLNPVYGESRTPLTFALNTQPEAYFKARYQNVPASVLCSQMTRTWKGEGQGFELKQRYIIKTIKPNDSDE